MAEEKDELLAQIRKLKNQMEEERQKHSKVDSAYTDGERMENGTDLHIIEMQSELTSLPGLCALIKNNPGIVLYSQTDVLCRRCQQTD